MKLRSSSSAGFTLIELLVVLGILGIVLGSAVLARPRTTDARLERTARSMAATLQLARSRAMVSNVDVIVAIDPVKGEFGYRNAMHKLPKGLSIAVKIAETERLGDAGGPSLLSRRAVERWRYSAELWGLHQADLGELVYRRAGHSPMTRRLAPPQIGSASSGGRDGFALIEIIVGCAVLALGVGTILVGVAVALRSDTQVRNIRFMNRIAQSRLEAAGIVSKLVVGQQQGRSGPFIWQETVTPATIVGGQKQGKSAKELESAVVPVWVEVVITSPGGYKESLSALKLAPRIAP